MEYRKNELKPGEQVILEINISDIQSAKKI